MTAETKKTIKPKIMKVTTYFFRGIDLVYKPIEKFWHIFTNVSRLSEKEIEAASKVFGADSIRYDAVRVAEGKLLKRIPWLHKNRSFVTFYTINIHKPRDNSSEHLRTMVHELTHVFQFEVIGSIYSWQALRAQWAFRDKAYKYGDWKGLAANRNQGWLFHDYNREQQGRIAQDYYGRVIEEGRLAEDYIRRAYEPFINELRKGEL